jgi:hypothetical protein
MDNLAWHEILKEIGRKPDLADKLDLALFYLRELLSVEDAVFDAIQGRFALSKAPAYMLAYFLKRPGQVCSRDQLLMSYSAGDATAKVVDVHIHRLRKALPPDVSIESLHGQGYRISVECAARLRKELEEYVSTLDLTPRSLFPGRTAIADTVPQRGVRWTNDDLIEVWRLHREGVPAWEIARKMRRTERGVNETIMRLTRLMRKKHS